MSKAESPGQTPTSKQPSLGQIIVSTLGAAVGVQSSKTHARDFSSGGIFRYIAAGIIFTALFIGGLVLLVHSLLNGS